MDAKSKLALKQRLLTKLPLVWLIGCLSVAGILLAKGQSAPQPQAPRYITKNIEDVQIGDYVLAKDPGQSGAPTPHRVVALPRNWTEHIVHVTVEGGGELKATRNHPFYVDGKGWVEARDLHVGDKLKDAEGRTVRVQKLWTEDRQADTFNLTVEGVHTYYVLAGATPVLVHNQNRIYITYTKVNPITGEVYSGRASGFGTPDDILTQRDYGHHMNSQGYGPAQLDEASTNRSAIRGREQQLIEQNGGAQSEGGTSGNAINGISPDNPKAGRYRRAAEREFGPCD